jgi:hypothetical protein
MWGGIKLKKPTNVDLRSRPDSWLDRRHRQLDSDIKKLERHSDSSGEVSILKRKKLRIKDEIERRQKIKVAAE